MFTILNYNEKNLLACFTNKYTSKEYLKNKSHLTYFKEYLGNNGLKARTILVEHKYVSKDFLDDYTFYYSKCFENYPKESKRIHFFSHNFNRPDFKKSILSRDESFLEEYYLGFIVIKPIPSNFIGFSLLKTYNNNNNRIFWGIREYKVNLFGTTIKLDSLAFQEQDSVISACATTALWSMLNKASINNHTILKSPSQITKEAAIIAYNGGRLFPNKGLTVKQIGRVIHNSGLDCEIRVGEYKPLPTERKKIPIISKSNIKRYISAYSSIGIPIILIISVPENDKYNLHAITVSGFYKKDKNPEFFEEKMSFLSDNIEKLYAHDDQQGPFSRLEFSKNEVVLTTNDKDLDDYMVWTNWTNFEKPTFVNYIMIPVFPKIRITLEDVEILAQGLDIILTPILKYLIKNDIVWDIKLEFSENLKKGIKFSKFLSQTRKVELITKNMPKYIWNISCVNNGNIYFSLILDATDVSENMYAIDIVNFLWKNDETSYIVDSLNQYRFRKENIFEHNNSSKYFDFIIDELNKY